MLFSLLLIVLVGLIAYYHYVQGLFSSILSATLAIIAAVVALGTHEAVVVQLLGGQMADIAHGLVLPVLFGGIYIVGRLVFDLFVPGNIRVQFMIDKIGSVIFGTIAGVFAVGIIAISVQLMPLGPAVIDFARYDIETREGTPQDRPGRRQADGLLFNQLTRATLDPADQRGLLLPVDAFVVGFTAAQSAGRAMGTEVRFADKFPDYLSTLFRQRLGVPEGARRVAMNVGTRQHVTARAAFLIDKLPAIEGEVDSLLNDALRMIKQPLEVITPGPEATLLAVQLRVSADAADKDGITRLSPGVIRLVVNGQEYNPIATVFRNSLLVMHRMDDPILIGSGGQDREFYVVFRVRWPDLFTDAGLSQARELGTSPAAGLRVPPRPGAFVEVKRLARSVLPPIAPGFGPANEMRSLLDETQSNDPPYKLDPVLRKVAAFRPRAAGQQYDQLPETQPRPAIRPAGNTATGD